MHHLKQQLLSFPKLHNWSSMNLRRFEEWFSRNPCRQYKSMRHFVFYFSIYILSQKHKVVFINYITPIYLSHPKGLNKKTQQSSWSKSLARVERKTPCNRNLRDPRRVVSVGTTGSRTEERQRDNVLIVETIVSLFFNLI